MTMAKKKAAGVLNKVNAKAAKKAKAAQKVERKEKKKVSKSKDEDEDEEDLEDILDKVIDSLFLVFDVLADDGTVDEAGMGGSTHSHRGDSRGPAESPRKCDPHPLSKWKPLVVHWRRILQRGWKGGQYNFVCAAVSQLIWNCTL